ncbi:Rossmann fold domain-containing protein [Sphingomonas endolithica]|uniref:Rossmann fold domain-containing protein n=1 Tax=Sphingomonas endolithica TaxID=2972485 RepID=UPI0021AEBB0C|nr:hypothetical protein [Sphingomonas sp. ZFBP2030]
MIEAAILTAVDNALKEEPATLLCSDLALPDLIAGIRAATTEFVLLLVLPTTPELDRAMLLAAIAPLAAERAPGHRICALDIKAGATVANIVATAQFLARAGSTTGQVIAVS